MEFLRNPCKEAESSWEVCQLNPAYHLFSSGLEHGIFPTAILNHKAILEDVLSALSHTLRMMAQRAEGGWVPSDPEASFPALDHQSPNFFYFFEHCYLRFLIFAQNLILIVYPFCFPRMGYFYYIYFIPIYVCPTQGNLFCNPQKIINIPLILSSAWLHLKYLTIPVNNYVPIKVPDKISSKAHWVCVIPKIIVSHYI